MGGRRLASWAVLALFYSSTAPLDLFTRDMGSSGGTRRKRNSSIPLKWHISDIALVSWLLQTNEAIALVCAVLLSDGSAGDDCVVPLRVVMVSGFNRMSTVVG